MYKILCILYYMMWFLTGAAAFSFLNVVMDRLPEHRQFIRGRSSCPVCRHILRWYDMIPVMNWIYLKGKCRYCRTSLSVVYPFMECLGGGCMIVCLLRFGTWNGFYHEPVLWVFFSFLILGLLTVIAGIDARTMLIPNRLNMLLGVMGVGACFFRSDIVFYERIIGMFCVSVPLLIITMLVPGSFGGGDMKLMAAAGFLLGWKMTLTAFLIAVVTGGGYGIFLLALKKKNRKEQFAFGPFLCTGIAISLLWGGNVLNWYLKLIGIG